MRRAQHSSYDGQVGTHLLTRVLQEHAAQPLHGGCEALRISREIHPAAVHWGARHVNSEGGHRSSWGTNSQS